MKIKSNRKLLSYFFYYIIAEFESIYALACSPTDAALVATGGTDHKAFYWRIGQGDLSKKLVGIYVLNSYIAKYLRDTLSSS